MLYIRRRQKSNPSNGQLNNEINSTIEDGELIVKLKDIKLPEEKESLVELLKNTIDQRKRSLCGDKAIFYAGFSLYKMDPELVSQNIRIYPNKNNLIIRIAISTGIA